MPQITVSEFNSTTTPLAAGATFTGAAESMLSFQEVDINVAGAPASASGTLTFEFSPDGVNWDISVARLAPSLPTIPLLLRVVLPLFRVRYLNGPTPQTEFRLTTILRVASATRLTRFPDQIIDLNEPTESIRVAPLGINFYVQARLTTNAVTTVPVNATLYTEQAAGARRSISSTSALDTAAGTGARTVQITYYTLTGAVVAGPFTEVVTLNGVTGVNTVATNICYVSQIRTLTVGTGGVNAGIIQLWTGLAATGTVFCSVAVGDVKTYLGVHYVPTGKIVTLTSIRATSAAATAQAPAFSIRSQPLGAANQAYNVLVTAFDVQGSTGMTTAPLGPARTIAGPARMQILVTPTNAASQVQNCVVDFYET